MLIQAAANEWKVPVAECTAANSVITHTPTGRTVTYGKVAEAAAKLEPPTDVKLKDPKDWKIVGKSMKRLDTADKTTGKMIYGIDVKRVMRSKLVLGVADGWLSADGSIIYRAMDLKVGLFRDEVLQPSGG